MEQVSSDCVQIAAACVVLSQSREVQAIVKKAVGANDFPTALALMKAGKLEGNIGDSVHDLLTDTIKNESIQVWSGFIHHTHDDYALMVNEYHGVFWVHAMEFAPVGYFLDEDSAVAFARSNWENVYEDGDEPVDDDESTDDDGELRCPFCQTTDNCDHFLITVDRTFRIAEGGPIYETFNSKWSDRSANQSEDEEFDEHDAFEELLEEVECLADEQVGSSPNSAPGMSSAYISFFCSSKKRTQSAIKKFNKS
jgi:hypothetical protein